MTGKGSVPMPEICRWLDSFVWHLEPHDSDMRDIEARQRIDRRSDREPAVTSVDE